MKILNTAAIIVIASTGLAAQEPAVAQPAKSYAEQFQALQPELSGLMAAFACQNVIDKVEAILPAALPSIEKDPENPLVGYESYEELRALQYLHQTLAQAYFLNGNYEKAVSNFGKASEIVNTIALEIDGIVAPLIDQWNTILAMSKQALDEAEQKVEQKKVLEAKGTKQTKAEKESLAKLEKELPIIEEYKPSWAANVQRAPGIIQHLNDTAKSAKSESGIYLPYIEGIQNDIRNEQNLIDSKFGGDKAKYVNSVVDTKENIESLTTQADKIKFLNRLLFLDPQSAAVKKQIDIVLGKG
jgi:tetratricopeptide (TPR) repeat protein